jgi:hypothetical protein
MNKLILSVGADDKYLSNPHLKNYLWSLSVNSNFDENILSYLGESNIDSGYQNINVARVPPLSIVKNNNNNCIQHGEFLNSEYFDKFEDNDVIVFTDGDMTLQRKLSQQEMSFLRNLGDDDVFVGYNQSPYDTLHDEYYRLSPIDYDYTKYFDYDLKNIKVYNTGVLCMNKKTWDKLRIKYIEHYDEITNLFGHYAKQQWLICLIFKLYNYNIIEMGYDLHNHTHYAPAEGTTNENGIVKYKNEIVLFKHRWF